MEGQVTDEELEVIITDNNLLMTCWFYNNGRVH